MPTKTDILRNEVGQLVKRAIEDLVFPGIEILFAHGESIIFHESFGKIDKSPDSPELGLNSLFDLASLTKPLATSPAILHLQEKGDLDINERISLYIPEIERIDTGSTTVRQLLTHISGLPDWLPLFEPDFDKTKAWTSLTSTPLQYEPGSQTIYSCLGFLLLAETVRRISMMSLDEYCSSFLFGPMDLNNFGFNPELNRDDIVPTAFCPYRRKYLRGVVHDENAFLFDGEGGNAGLFGTAEEIHQFCLMLLNNGEFKGNPLFSRESADLMTENQNAGHLAPRTMGWDYKVSNDVYMSCGKRMPIGSIGHLGFTGTSIWFDPQSGYIVVLLSNRVNITREANIPRMMEFRPKIHDLLLAAVM